VLEALLNKVTSLEARLATRTDSGAEGNMDKEALAEAVTNAVRAALPRAPRGRVPRTAATSVRLDRSKFDVSKERPICFGHSTYTLWLNT